MGQEINPKRAVLALYAVFTLFSVIYLIVSNQTSDIRPGRDITLPLLSVEKKITTWDQVDVEKKTKIANLRLELDHLKSLERDKYGGRTLFLENDLIMEPYEPSDDHAIVTMMGVPSPGHGYWMGVLALFQSLREVQTRVPHLVVMVAHLESIPSFVFESFESLGVELIEIENIKIDENYPNVDIPGTWSK